MKKRPASGSDVEFSRQVEDAAYFFPPAPPARGEPLSLVCGGRERCQPDYLVNRRDFRYYSVEFVAGGRGEVMLAGRRHPLGPGMLFGYGPGIPHRIRTDSRAPMTKYFIDFTGPGARAFFRSALFAGAPVQVSDPLRIRELLDDIQRTALARGPLAGDICALQLRLLVLRVHELVITGSVVHERAIETFLRCRAAIEQHAMAWTTQREIARACRLDPAYLCRLFRRFGNATPYGYLLRQKMNHAAERLLRSDVLVKEVADALGFRDPFHFSRVFKRVHGFSPRQFIETRRRA